MHRSPIDLPRFGTGIGLHRVARGINALGLSIRDFCHKSVVITGSNGKGTVATVLADLASNCGIRTGVFTSPHIYDFNERFRVDGEMVSDYELNRTAEIIRGVINELTAELDKETFGEFEAWFLQSLLIFQRSNVDFCVFEAGIGGRYDPTRLIKPDHSCITSVDLEHTQLLGNTIREIALDKLDICPSGANIVLGDDLKMEQATLLTMAWLKGINISWISDDALKVSLA